MRRARSLQALTVAAVCAPWPLAVLGGCQRRESVEAARARATEAFLAAQVADLKGLLARAESGQLVRKDRIAIGIAEESVKALIDASLPQEQVLGGRVTVRIESAQAYFRGNNAGLVFQASARGRRGIARGASVGIDRTPADYREVGGAGEARQCGSRSSG